MKKMRDFFVYYAHKPTLMLIVAMLGFLKTLLEIVNIYLFDDWQLLASLLIITHIDTILGVWLATIRKQISSKGFSGYFIKHIVYMLLLIAFHVLTNLKIKGKPVVFFFWINNAFCVAILVRELISIVEKVGAIKPDLIPPWILSYLKKFDSTGKVEPLNN
ncbi:phage holin family protein [Runella sp.]|uniref:phage holin family protein n=1 Tax=Runella sp. TaxID=1960881 RepID=UPI003017329E